MRGLEPPRCRHHRLLRPARLPVPPHPHVEIHYANGLRQCQESTMSGRERAPSPATPPQGAQFFGAICLADSLFTPSTGEATRAAR